MKTQKLYIGNEWMESAGTREVIDPATGETIAVVGEASREDVERAVAAARVPVVRQRRWTMGVRQWLARESATRTLPPLA